MAGQSGYWDDMFRTLEAFKKEHGHCHVQANWKKNPRLGRLVARQRFLHKVGELPKHQVDRLNQIAFVWSPTDMIWNEMLQRLIRYKEKHGNCNVPTACPTDPDLGNWVATQRHAKRVGSLSEERVQKLAEIGFAWSILKRGLAAESVVVERQVAPQPVKAVELIEEHLYQITGSYIQYNGAGPRPAKLEKYVQLHGELPPSIILPRSPLVFRIGNSEFDRVHVRKFKWSGKGPIPAEVLEHLNENGALPPHS